MSHASQAMLDSEFGTHKEEDVVQKVLESGSLHESSVCFCLYHFNIVAVLQVRMSNIFCSPQLFSFGCVTPHCGAHTSSCGGGLQ